ncbi:protein encore isoform X2 [Chelonus insularis]|uniref:protein encore isoform X2 n=1 Tax=Chelonus insularis TaxID=460826 RepID=UPI00158D7C5C|nr:protein encore isoform X2 [Chelonus insularis]
MARLEIPSIVVHKGSRSQSRPSSPIGPSSTGMPALPSAKNALVTGAINEAYSGSVDDEEMLDGDVNIAVENLSSGNTINRPTSLPVPSCQPSPPDKDPESNNFRNRANTKVKLLVRSHAMRESTSPPREPHNGAASPRSPQSDGGSEKKLGNGGLSPNNSTLKLNNNESIYNSNLGAAQSPKQTRNTATSPTCRTPSRNGNSSPLQTPKSASTSPTNNGRDKNDSQRSKATSPLAPKCNNCVKSNQIEKPGLLQTPQSPSKSTGIQCSPKNSNLSGQNNHNGHNCQSRSENNRRSLSVCNNQCSNQCSGNTLSVGNRTRHKLRHQNSSQGSGSLDSMSPCLSRDSSTELYTDSTGIDLEQFIAVTINRNQKDRSILLKIERELIEFAKDRQKVCHKFPNMSSYNRMLVHRVAAYFGMEHNVDQSGLSVIVTRTKNMRIPDTRFKEHIRDDLILAEEPRRSILKRDSSSFEDGYNFKSPDRLSGDYGRRSKSFEEREEEYEKARRRIFKDSSGESSEVTSWPYWSSSESSDASARYRLLHSSDHPSIRQTRLSKGESCDGRESFRGVLRPSVSKSFSFGGYTRGMLSRGDSVTSTRSASARLTKQDSGASMCSRLSPSSSGYKSQSQRSDATISPSPSPSPIPTIPCNHGQSSQNSTLDVPQSNDTVIWAVSNISSVPPGSIIMNPRTNQPYINPDGSIYRFDPENPPKIFNDIEEIRESPSEGLSDKFSDVPESPRHSGNNKTNIKKQKNPSKLSGTNHNNNSNNNNNNSNNTNHRVTNTATSPTLPYSASSPPLQVQECTQSVVKSPNESQSCPHGTLNQSFGNYSQNSSSEIPYNHPPVFPGSQPQGMVLQRPPDMPGTQQPPPTDIVFGQNYGNYSMMMQTAIHPQSTDVADLSGYFMGMNVYEQSRAGAESAQTPQTFSGPPPPPPPPPNSHHNSQNTSGIQSGYWQPPPPPPPPSQTQGHPHNHPPNQIPPQHMYFVPPSGSALPVGQASNDRPGIQHQRFTSSYTYNPQTMTPPNQTTPNYVSGYPISYNSMPVAPNPNEYPYQNPLPMVPTYYPGQPGIQPPVMWRVPTPPNTPTSNQMPGIPVMYVNSGTYPPPMVTTGSFSHQLSSATPAPPPGTVYMTPSLLPNLVFRQNVPMVPTGIRTSTPSGSQRTSRSPTPAHDFCNNPANGGNNNGASGDNRNAQSQSRYPLPMYQGLHIVQGDIRLMHPGMANNSRLQYAPVSSPPVVQGCPRPFRPPSYSSNNSGCPTPNSFDGRNQKVRKQRDREGDNYPSKPTGTILNNEKNNIKNDRNFEKNIHNKKLHFGTKTE